MKRRDFVLAVISLCSKDSDFGRTSLQKVAYLVAAARGFDFRHHAYFYGPYSEAVEADVEALSLSGLVEEKRRTLGYNARGEISKYEYLITPEGEARIAQLQSVYEGEVKALKYFVDRLREAAGGLHQQILSTAAKVHFIQSRDGDHLEPEQIQQIARSFGWSLGTAQIKKVRDVLNSLQLVPQDEGGF